ncbi:inorganic diphosphatase [Massilia sp. W12]|uniref:inorganic diphosphatase n=1 Tax=Massilia sp. W12 TaxID=3126507 RepID=UPI0030D26D26
MSLNNVKPGKDVPNVFNVIIEIAAQSDPIKYEIDKESGAVFVDRFVGTGMRYPVNYGYIPDTIAGDGDPVDVLVISPFPLPPGVVVRCRPLGLLKMTDDGGQDAKVLAVPVDKLTPLYKNWQEYTDAPELLLNQIRFFFENYKALEPGKWVKMDGWGGKAEAIGEIETGLKNYKG